MTQFDFLKEHEGKNVTVFLVNGVKLQGKVFDCANESYETLYIERDGVTQMVYKHAIATVMPQPKHNYDYDNPAHNGGY